MLDENTSKRVNDTLPIFTAHSKQIADQFYRNLFSGQPGLKRLFSTEFLYGHGANPLLQKACPFPTIATRRSAQSQILADSILFFCAHLGNLPACKPLVDRICAKHISRMVQPAHYDALVPAFENAAREVLAGKISEEDFEAWLKAVKLVAGILMGEEEKMYNALENEHGAWKGFRPFTGAQLHADDQNVYFGLTPTDGKPIVTCKPGQKVCMRLDTQNHDRIFADATLSAHSLTATENATSLKIETHQGLVYANASTNLNLELLYVIELPKPQTRVLRSPVRLFSSRLAVERLTKYKEIHISTPFGQCRDEQESPVTSSWDVARRNHAKRRTWDSFADDVDIHQTEGKK